MRQSTSVIDLRDSWIPFIMAFSPLVLGWVGACLFGHGWRERLGLSLMVTMLFLIMAQ